MIWISAEMDNNRLFYSPPHLEGSLSGSTQTPGNSLQILSPWSFSSDAAEQALITLPSLTASLNPDSIAGETTFFDRLNSPSSFLLARPADEHSQTRPSNTNRYGPSSMNSMSHGSLFSSPTSDAFRDFVHTPQLQTRQSSVVDLTDSPPFNMPAATREAALAEPSKKRSRSKTPTAEQSLENKRACPNSKEIEEVDLVEIESDASYRAFQKRKKAEETAQKQQDDINAPVKLSQFQCIICLDSPTDLTVTWCGHLFCSQCLHEALHAGTQKKVCPICRQGISTNPTVNKKDGTSKPPKNGTFPLTMKLMTAKRKGKQASR